MNYEQGFDNLCGLAHLKNNRSETKKSTTYYWSIPRHLYYLGIHISIQ